MKSAKSKIENTLWEVYPTWESSSSIRYVIDKCGYDSTQRQLGLTNTFMKALNYHLLILEEGYNYDRGN